MTDFASRDKKISISQAANIATQLAIAQKGKDVTVEDVCTLTTEVYVKVMGGTLTDIFFGKHIKPLTTAQHIAKLKECTTLKEVIEYKAKNPEMVENTPKEDQEKIKRITEGLILKED
jgi:hypothetical protein